MRWITHKLAALSDVYKRQAQDLAKDSFQVTAYTRLNTDAISSTAILDFAGKAIQNTGIVEEQVMLTEYSAVMSGVITSGIPILSLIHILLPPGQTAALPRGFETSFCLASRPLIAHAVNGLDVGCAAVRFDLAANPADGSCQGVFVHKPLVYICLLYTSRCV